MGVRKGETEVGGREREKEREKEEEWKEENGRKR
jgi:hypothetical protein